jgi:sensor histidine kinase YesM
LHMNSTFIHHLLQQLNGISSIAAMENAFETQKMIKSLTDVLRYRFGREHHIIQIRDEWHALQTLMRIYKNRFGDQLQYTEKIDDSALNAYIPHYCLVAFIDWAIKEGFEQQEGVCHIQLSITMLDNHLAQITIDGQVADQLAGILRDSGNTNQEAVDYDSIAGACNRIVSYTHLPASQIFRISNLSPVGQRICILLGQEEERI